MKTKHIIISILIVILGLSIIQCVTPTKQPQITENTYHYQQTGSQLIVIKRRPTIGECLMAPVDFVVGICSGCIKGVGYGTAYIAETITPTRLYPEDDRCCFCDAKHINSYCNKPLDVNLIQCDITKEQTLK